MSAAAGASATADAAAETCQMAFTDPLLFTATATAQMNLVGAPDGTPLRNLVALGELIAGELRRWDTSAGTRPPAVVAINSNFIHEVLPSCRGLTRRIDKTRPANAPPLPARAQGDATCFQSAIEIHIVPEYSNHPRAREVAETIGDRKGTKVFYQLKLFPSTGQTQVTGCLYEDGADGAMVFDIWADFMQGIFDRNPDHRDVRVEMGAPNIVLRNYKMRLTPTPGVPETQRTINIYLMGLYFIKIRDGDADPEDAPPDPYEVKEVSTAQSHQDLSFVFKDGQKPTRVKIFRSGKVNALSCVSTERAQTLHRYISGVLERHPEWDSHPRRPAGENFDSSDSDSGDAAGAGAAEAAAAGVSMEEALAILDDYSDEDDY